jgi:multiple sugar transport system permease protein
MGESRRAQPEGPPVGAAARASLAGRLAAHGVLLPAALLWLLPFIWMLCTAFKAPGEIFEASLWPLPRSWFGLAHFSEVLRSVPMGRYMLNGLIVCSGILAVQLLVAVPAAYALAKLRFAGRQWLFIAILGALAIPIQVIALPVYIGLSHAGALNTYFAQMLPFFLSMFAIFLLRQVFKTFPDDLIHAARLDGMTELEIVWRIVAPSARPAIAAFAVFSIVAHWNDLYWPLIVISATELAPPPLGMLLFASAESGANYGALMAGATLITAPMLIAFLVARRRFIQGITMTGLR